MAFALVEIKCEDTLAFYTGYVKDVDRDHALVAYEGGWQRDTWLPVSSLRPSLPPYNSAQFNPLPGEVVEVKAKSAENEPYSWWRGSVKSVRPNPALASLPDSLGSTANQLVYEISYAGWENEFTETLEKDMLRPFNKQAYFAPGDIEKHALPLAPQMAQMLSPDVLQPMHYNAGTLAFFIEPAGSVPVYPPPSAAFQPPAQPTMQPHIIVIGSKPNCQRAVILLANQLKLLNEQTQLQQQQQAHAAAAFHDDHQHHHQHHQQQHGYGGGGGGGGYRQSHNAYGGRSSPMSPFSSHPPSHGGLPYSAANPPFTLEFHAPPHLMGMVIGKRHKNLYIAENLDGIYKVHVDTENGTIVVVAKSAEAAAAARSLLELTEQTLQIPSVIVGRVVGKNFQMIKAVEQHSGVLRIKVGDDRDVELELLQQLAINGIPGLPKHEQQHDSRTHADDLQIAAAAADNPAASAAAAGTDKEKRSAFAVNYRERESSRGGRRFDRGGRFGEDKGDDKPEEFDIVALEDDKTVEISIIGSPATVSEAELLLRTHIGLITQIYKLSYDEAMLRRQVEALSLVVPTKGLLPSSSATGSGSAWGGEREREHKRRPKDDTHMPAWMNDNVAKEEKLLPTPLPAATGRRKQDPSTDIHAARLEGKPAAPRDAASSSPATTAESGSADSGDQAGRRSDAQRKRGGKKPQRREPRESKEPAAAGSDAAAAAQPQKRRGERNGRGGGGRRANGAAAEESTAGAAPSSEASSAPAASVAAAQ